MEKILSMLEKLNFTKTEAEVYVTLLTYPNQSGYQIAKKIKLSRSSIYAALDNLYKRGIVSLVPGDVSIYKAQNPEVLIDNMKKDFIQSADILKDELSKVNQKDTEERYLNIEGYDNIILKVKELLLMAEEEVYMNTDFNLQLFSKELRELKKRGVRIIVFSFSKFDTEDIPVEFYSHGIEVASCGADTRMMLVVDYKKTLIANGENHQQFLGTFTDNKLLASIVAEHIHHDIYLLKLNKIYGKEVVDQSVLLNTLLEQENCHNEIIKNKLE
ncbi:TrmB family transcriptional regulator [Vallitalea okinawensis]|uniref:TrmB family transcriptional regulator n=1 Tax=Vallitalea okinawensis TaxID=2078660 RepID=UPI000CFCFC09|nr:TrmB family transcriptional regulator [Vallitalea okinawensis]